MGKGNICFQVYGGVEVVKQVYNFNAGPAALPATVLAQAQAELLDFNQTGMSVMELSHRGLDYEGVHNEAQHLLRELLAIPDDYAVLFLQGGASLQFSMIPMNFLTNAQCGNYVLTGVWSEKALAEGDLLGDTFVGASSKEINYTKIPNLNEIVVRDQDAYVHITTNNTIYGTQWHQYPNFTTTPLLADMSSDILSKPIPINQFGLIYAGAQKNLGPSGVTVVIVKQELLNNRATAIPTMLKYRTYFDNNSMYNTPPTFGIYVLGLVLKDAQAKGGLAVIAKENKIKAQLLYEVIDGSNGFYQGHAKSCSRSLMNVTFTLPTETLTQDFLAKATAAGFVGLNGHRLVGGCRASTYNAVPLATCEALRDFMLAFHKQS